MTGAGVISAFSCSLRNIWATEGGVPLSLGFTSGGPEIIFSLHLKEAKNYFIFSGKDGTQWCVFNLPLSLNTLWFFVLKTRFSGKKILRLREKASIFSLPRKTK
jgi:hypothetical protein